MTLRRTNEKPVTGIRVVVVQPVIVVDTPAQQSDRPGRQYVHCGGKGSRHQSIVVADEGDVLARGVAVRTFAKSLVMLAFVAKLHHSATRHEARHDRSRQKPTHDSALQQKQ
jgi:hypothetical protein